MDWDAFFSKFSITEEYFKASECDKGCLEAILADYGRQKSDYEDAAESIARRLQRVKEVHSVRTRAKDPEHLIEKIIRKQKESRDPPKPDTAPNAKAKGKAKAKPKAEPKAEPKPRNITLENYRQEITDLAGVRALHLFKADWLPIHKAVLRKWDLKEGEGPLAYVREGDSDDFRRQFQDNECDVEDHPKYYRSVHYVLDLADKSGPFFVEIQVRTIFEEGWSEIDHRVRYPYEKIDAPLKDFLDTFNRLAGTADEMGTIVQLLKNQRDAYVQRDEKIRTLRSLVDNLDIGKEFKRLLGETLRFIQSEPEMALPEKYAFPENYQFSLAAATDSLEDDQIAKARKYMDLVKTQIPDDASPLSLISCARLLYDIGNYEESLQFCSRYLKNRDTDWEARFLRAKALVRSLPKRVKASKNPMSVIIGELEVILAQSPEMREQILLECEPGAAFRKLMEYDDFFDWYKSLANKDGA